MALTLYIKNGDWVLDEATGRPLTTSGLAKVKQEFRELLSIETQPSGFGSSIIDVVGTVPDHPDVTAFTVMERISSAVERWRGLQRRLRATLARNETIAKLVFNQARVDDADPTSVIFRAAVRTVAGEDVVNGGAITSVSGA